MTPSKKCAESSPRDPFSAKISSFRAVKHKSAFKQKDLRQKIVLENKLLKGAEKLIEACNHSYQTLEAAKHLIASRERIISCTAALQNQGSKTEDVKSTAKVGLSDLRIPLAWKDTDHFKNKGDYRRFAVFCLVRIGTDVFDTCMLSPVDRSLTDLTFDDEIVFENVLPDFDIIIEVYSHKLDDLSIASTSRKLKQTLHSSISRTMGRKIASSIKTEFNCEDSYYFQKVATSKLKLADSSNFIKPHDLVLEASQAAFSQLPLFGHFCCRLSVEPQCYTSDVVSGVALCSWKPNQQLEEHWVLLQKALVQIWQTERCYRNKDMAKYEFHFSPDMKVIPNKEHKELKLENFDCMLLVKCLDSERYEFWQQNIQKQLSNFLLWQHCFLNPMNILPSKFQAHAMYRRTGSLYEDVPIKAEGSAVLQNGTSLLLHDAPCHSMRLRSKSMFWWFPKSHRKCLT